MKNILIIIFIFLVNTSYSQGFNNDKVELSNFLKRMYTASPFEDVKLMEDYDNKYLISVLSLEKAKYQSASIMNRVAQVKAQSQTSRFFNGSTVSEDFIIRTTETTQSNNTTSVTETFQMIKENSIGFVNGLELLTNFEIEEGKKMLFIYIKQL